MGKIVAAQTSKPTKKVTVGLVAKYMDNEDTYISILEALKAAAWEPKVGLNVKWINAEKTTKDDFSSVDALLVPGGFGSRGVDGKIAAATYALEHNVPYLGICLGLQLLFDLSEEDGAHRGLGVLGGRVVRFRPEPDNHAMKVPHMGWNALHWDNGANPLLHGLQPGASSVYFVHSYYAVPDDRAVIATSTQYGGEFCSSVRRDNVFATQFHPEKSQQVGLRMLANFAAI